MTYLSPNFQNAGTLKVALAALDTAGGVLAVANPFGADVIVKSLILDVTTAATAACTIDAGIAANGTTSNDGLIDGQDVNAAAGAFKNSAVKKWGASQYLTISKASGAAAGLVGNAYIEVQRV
jgi:hypothetical protein